jgi:hypothetical protein
MDERVGVDCFEGAGGVEGGLLIATADFAGKQDEYRAEAFAASEQAVLDGILKAGWPTSADGAATQLVFDLLTQASNMLLKVF